MSECSPALQILYQLRDKAKEKRIERQPSHSRMSILLSGCAHQLRLLIGFPLLGWGQPALF